MTLLVHIVAGGLGLVSGALALAATKGAGLHRRSGMAFVYSMLTMSLLGAGIAATQGTRISVIAGLLTAYLVFTALTTVRPPNRFSRRLDVAAMLLAFAVGAGGVGIGLQALAEGGRSRAWAPMFLVFGGVALLGAAGDFRMLRAGGVRGPRRLARHLWRMCFALLLATVSFFLGQADEFPKALQIPGLLASPAVAVLVVMLYWLWKLRRPARRPAIPVDDGALADLS
jgi:hypothetical protein